MLNLNSKHWAITRERLETLHKDVDAIALVLNGINTQNLGTLLQRKMVSDAALIHQSITTTTSDNQQGIAVISLQGVVLARAPEWYQSFGYTDPYRFAQKVAAAAANTNVKSIVLDISSPGGTVDGTDIAAEAVAKAAAVKPVVAVIAGMGCSAAYWIASQATRIIASPSSVVGSIGVITKHYDYTAYLDVLGIKATIIRTGEKKALGQPEESMSETMLAEIQSELEDMLDVFLEGVAKGRKMPKTEVKKRWGDGHTKVGASALESGLIDGIGNLADVVAEEQSKLGASARRVEKGDNVKFQIKLRNGSVLVLDTESATFEQELQAAHSADIATAESAGRQAQLEEIAAVLAVEPKNLTVATLQGIAAAANDGKAYRENLEQRFTAAAVRAYGQEKGAAHSETMLKAFKHLSTADLESQIDLLEQQANALFPDGRVSQEDAPTKAARKPNPDDMA